MLPFRQKNWTKQKRDDEYENAVTCSACGRCPTFVDDLGADSLDVFQIIMGIEDTFNIQIPEDAAEHITTVAEAVEQIQAAKAQ